LGACPNEQPLPGGKDERSVYAEPKIYAVSRLISVVRAVTSPVYDSQPRRNSDGCKCAVINDARVTARNIDTGLTQTAITTSAGAFIIPRLPVGNYEIKVEKAGFAVYVQSGITLVVNQAASLTVTLQVSQVTNQVTVSGEPELVITRTATAGQVVGRAAIEELPLNGRRPERLMYLAAGTVDLGRDHCLICTNGGIYPGEETAGINGSLQGQVNYQLDATDHNDTYMNSSLPFPNPDAIEEFSLLSSNFSAEYGNSGMPAAALLTSSPARALTRFTGTLLSSCAMAT